MQSGEKCMHFFQKMQKMQSYRTNKGNSVAIIGMISCVFIRTPHYSLTTGPCKLYRQVTATVGSNLIVKDLKILLLENAMFVKTF